MSCNDNQILHVIHDGNYIECRDSESNWQGYHFGSYASCNGAGEWSTDILNGCPDSGWNYLCGYETGEHWDCLLCGSPAGQMAYSGEGPWPESPYYDFWCEDIASPPKTIGKESIKRKNELLIRSCNTGKTPRNPALNSSRSECPTGYMMRNGICSEDLSRITNPRIRGGRDRNPCPPHCLDPGTFSCYLDTSTPEYIYSGWQISNQCTPGAYVPHIYPQMCTHHITNQRCLVHYNNCHPACYDEYDEIYNPITHQECVQLYGLCGTQPPGGCEDCSFIKYQRTYIAPDGSPPKSPWRRGGRVKRGRRRR